MADILSYGPCQSMDGDGDLIACGLVEYYDNDPEYVIGTEGAEESLYDTTQYRVRDCWRNDDEPPAADVNINCNVANRHNLVYGAQSSPEYHRLNGNDSLIK